jgi:transposase
MDKDTSMSAKEINQIEVFEKLSREELKQKQAAKILNLSVRQVRRKLKKYKAIGPSSLVHKLRGKRSNRRIAQTEVDRAIKVIKEKYWDFGPTFAHEKLLQEHEVDFSVETLRQAMITAGIWIPKTRKRQNHHPLRERRSCFGSLVQVDGSPHNWFEDRGPRCNLNVMVDDATNICLLRFSKAEDTQSYFQTLMDYLPTYGLPLAFYIDKHSVFKVNKPHNLDYKKPSLTDSFQTQFSRAMKEISIPLIFASTPQAKGRVERLNLTLQDRLTKELRLAGVSDIEEANLFLKEFTKKFNAQFSVEPKSKLNMHRPLDPNIDLSKILCFKYKRVLSKNLTCQFENIVYQIDTNRSARSLSKTLVTITKSLKGKIRIYDHRGKEFKFFTKRILPKVLRANSKNLNSKVDDILRKNNQQKKNPWEFSPKELDGYQPNH